MDSGLSTSLWTVQWTVQWTVLLCMLHLCTQGFTRQDQRIEHVLMRVVGSITSRSVGGFMHRSSQLTR